MGKRHRKTDLVEIAYRLIAQNGLEGFRIRQVAAEAGIDNGTLHYHFPSKDALILGVVDYLIEDLKKNPSFRKVWNRPLSTNFAWSSKITACVCVVHPNNP